MSRLDWDKYSPYFKRDEFVCSHSGKCRMDEDFMDILYQIRKTYAKPMIITSGYRDISHPLEAKKKKPGTHSYGLAADIKCNGEDAMGLMVIAYGYGIRRFGLFQKGLMEGRFMHIDYGDKLYGFPPAIWSY